MDEAGGLGQRANVFAGDACAVGFGWTLNVVNAPGDFVGNRDCENVHGVCVCV